MYKEITKITLYGIIRSLGICDFFKIEIEKNECIVNLKKIIMKIIWIGKDWRYIWKPI